MGTPISLYLDLEPGQKPDLEVVARASLAFSKTVKELAYIIDPSISVRVELVSGTDGSLNLNSVIQAPKGVKISANARWGLLWGILVFFGPDIKNWAVAKFMDYVISRQPELAEDRLSEGDVQRIIEGVAKIIAKGPPAESAREVYKEVEKDTSISGIGASPAPDERPEYIVPRSSFPRMASLPEPTETEVTRRTVPSRARLTVTKAVLVPGDGHWRFAFGEQKFGAPVKDAAFVERLLSGQILIPMVSGVELDVEMITIEEKVDGVWEIKDRAITKVIEIHMPGSGQISLFPRPPE